MTTAAATATRYELGQAVVFDGRAGTIIRADAPKADTFGKVSQTLIVKTYAGEHMIGSVHSRLKPMPSLGDRVLVAVSIMGETFDVECIVADYQGAAILARPEGSLTVFRRTEWIAL